jgi:hypothetical protein
MFALNSGTPQHARVRPYYSELFDLLDSLVKLQLIVCPASPAHHDESAVSAHYAQLNRLVEHLGNGCSFWDASEVRRFQLSVHCWNWVQGKAEEEPMFATDQFVHGELHEWSDRILLTVERQVSNEDIEAIRRQRDGVSEGLRAIFARWQTESLSFDQRLQQELRAFGPATLRQHTRFYKELDEVARGLRPSTLETIFPTTSVVLVNTMCRYLQDRGMSQREAADAVERYLHSDGLQFVPSLRISCMLWAALARKASSGQKRPPTQGMNNDVEVASAVLPYVDAAFLDNEVRGLLCEEPLRSRSGITARLFSSNNVDEFLAYLRGLIADAPLPHLELARSVYGEDGLLPYTGIFDDEAGRGRNTEDDPLERGSSS